MEDHRRIYIGNPSIGFTETVPQNEIVRRGGGDEYMFSDGSNLKIGSAETSYLGIEGSRIRPNSEIVKLLGLNDPKDTSSTFKEENINILCRQFYLRQ